MVREVAPRRGRATGKLLLSAQPRSPARARAQARARAWPRSVGLRLSRQQSDPTFLPSRLLSQIPRLELLEKPPTPRPAVSVEKYVAA